jgi:hypothetical protein
MRDGILYVDESECESKKYQQLFVLIESLAVFK